MCFHFLTLNSHSQDLAFIADDVFIQNEALKKKKNVHSGMFLLQHS